MTEKVKEKVEQTPDKKESVYATLKKIDVKPYIKKKMNLDYLSWATAWGLVKSHYPDAKKEFTEFPEYILAKEGWIATGRKVPYRLTPFGCEVEATVTIDGEKTSQNLYVMNNRGQAVKAKDLDMKLINTAQQRCLVKALATAGLGLEIYAGEDLPEDPPKKNSQQHMSQPVPRKLSKAQLENYTIEFSDGKKHTLKAIFERAKTNDVIKQWIRSGNYDNTTKAYIKQLGGIYKAEQEMKAQSNQAQQPVPEDDGFEEIIAK